VIYYIISIDVKYIPSKGSAVAYYVYRLSQHNGKELLLINGMVTCSLLIIIVYLIPHVIISLILIINKCGDDAMRRY